MFVLVLYLNNFLMKQCLFKLTSFCAYWGHCPEPGGVPFAARTKYSGPYNLGDQVTYSCFHGITGTITCQKNRAWTQKPSCTGWLLLCVTGSVLVQQRTDVHIRVNDWKQNSRSWTSFDCLHWHETNSDNFAFFLPLLHSTPFAMPNNSHWIMQIFQKQGVLAPICCLGINNKQEKRMTQVTQVCCMYQGLAFSTEKNKNDVFNCWQQKNLCVSSQKVFSLCICTRFVCPLFDQIKQDAWPHLSSLQLIWHMSGLALELEFPLSSLLLHLW